MDVRLVLCMLALCAGGVAIGDPSATDRVGDEIAAIEARVAAHHVAGRATNVYVIDGTTYSKFSDLPPLVDGDRIEVDPAHIIYEGEVEFNGIDRLTITRKAGTQGYGVKRNAVEVELTTLVSSNGLDVWRTEIGEVSFIPQSLWENWDDPLNADEHGFQTAFVRQSFVDLDDINRRRSWWWDSSDGTIYVSVPSGVDASKQQYLVGIEGHGIVFTNCTNSLVEHMSLELTTESGNTKGYGFREAFASSGNIVRDCRFRGNQYHCLGSVANSCSLVSMNNDMGLQSIANDSQLVFFSRTGSTNGARSINDVFHLVPWLDVDGRPHSDGRMLSIGTHRAEGAQPTAVGGIQIINPTCKRYGYNPTVGSIFLGLTAPTPGHTPPAAGDELNPNKYPIIVWGGNIEATAPCVIGGNSPAMTAAAFVRTKFNLDCSDMYVLPPGGSSFAVIVGDSNVTSASTLALIACTISAELPATSNAHTIFGAKQNGARLILENCSVKLVGDYSTQKRLFTFVSSTGLIQVRGTAFDVDDSDTRLFSGGTQDLLDDPSRFDFTDNMYTTRLNNIMWAGHSLSREDFRQIHDPTGEFFADPVYLDDSTLEPDAVTQELKSDTKLTGPVGINELQYDGTYGAWQYDKSPACVADFTDDGVLDFFDISAFLVAFATRTPEADLNLDSVHNFFDVSVFLASFASGCP